MPGHLVIAADDMIVGHGDDHGDLGALGVLGHGEGSFGCGWCVEMGLEPSIRRCTTVAYCNGLCVPPGMMVSATPPPIDLNAHSLFVLSCMTPLPSLGRARRQLL